MATADLVLEGGGVKGIGLVGAISVLEEHGYEFHRIAGTSAGAIVGAMVAAGIPIADLQQIMWKVDYNKFQDAATFSRFGPLGKGIEILFHDGIYKGQYLLDWLTEQLASVGKHTFADLRLDDPGRLRRSAAHLPPGGDDVRPVAGSPRAPAVGLPVPARAAAGRREDRGRGAHVDVDPAVLPAVARRRQLLRRRRHAVELPGRRLRPRRRGRAALAHLRHQAVGQARRQPEADAHRWPHRPAEGDGRHDDQLPRPDVPRPAVGGRPHDLRGLRQAPGHGLQPHRRRQEDAVRQRAGRGREIPGHVGLRRVQGQVPGATGGRPGP